MRRALLGASSGNAARLFGDGWWIKLTVQRDIWETGEGMRIARALAASLLCIPRLAGCPLRLCTCEDLQQLAYNTTLWTRRIMPLTSRSVEL